MGMYVHIPDDKGSIIYHYGAAQRSPDAINVTKQLNDSDHRWLMNILHAIY
jgi:hypothetical protein